MIDSEVEYRTLSWLHGYRIGSDGTVWTSRTKGSKNQNAVGPWKPVSTYRRPYGGRYFVVCFRTQPGDKVKCFYVHRLVLEAFIGPCPEKMTACHNDGNTANNFVSNLRWDTHTNNIADKLRHGTNERQNLTDLTGIRFGRLVAIGRAKRMPWKRRPYAWLCKCDCGREKIVAAVSLTKTKSPTRSCGCLLSKRVRKELAAAKAVAAFLESLTPA